MTPLDLNERIDGVLKAMFLSDAKPLVKQAHVEAGREHIKQLLYDAIQAVTPAGRSEDYDLSMAHRTENYGYNRAIDAVEENTKNLLGEKT